MEKVLLLNGSHSEITLLMELKKLNKYVITTGNLPESFVHKYADKYIQADYSDAEKILNIARQEKISGIVSCANDFGIITASYVAEKMGLLGYDSFEITKMLHQKDLFKSFAMENKLMVPKSMQFDSVDEALTSCEKLSFPVIVKPADLTGGKGVIRLDSVKNYEEAIEAAFLKSRKKKIVVEEFVEGTYHSFSTFLVDKKVIAYYSDNEYSNVYPYFVDTSVGPADYIEEVKDVLVSQAEIIAGILNLVDGVFHMQYVLDKNGMPYIFDITRRCSGDIYPEPVEHATGIPWSKWIVMSELGYNSEVFKERGKQHKICGRHCIMADSEGFVEDVIIGENIKQYIYRDYQWWKPGYKINNHKVDKLGILFYEFSTIEEMNTVVKNIKQTVRVKIRGEE